MLTKTQIRYLKAQAHHIHPVILLGANGLTESVQKEINIALNSHELIKIKLGQLPDDEQKKMIDNIISEQQAEFIQKIGHTAIFYRENVENKRYILPK